MNDLIEVFSDHEVLMKRLKKNEYIKNMEVFRTKFALQLKNLLEYKGSGEGEDTDDRYSVPVSQLYEKYSFLGKVGKLKTHDLSLFMVFYVFPAMLLVGKEEYGPEETTAACDSLVAAWNNRFGSDIKYIDYNTLIAGFNTKMFGIF